MSFVPEQEARNFDRQVMTFWSHLIQRDIASPLFLLSLKLGGLGVGSAVQRHAAAPWRAWQSIITTLMETTQSPDTDSLCSSTPRLRAQLAQVQTTLSLQMNKPNFQLKPLGAAIRLKITQKKQVSTRNIHKQFCNSHTDTPTEQAVLLSQSTPHTGAHLMQPSSEANEAEDRCFRVSVARRLMLPHTAAPNAADVVQFCPNQSAAGVICNKPVDPQQHHCHGCQYGGGVDRRHAAVGRCFCGRHTKTSPENGFTHLLLITVFSSPLSTSLFPLSLSSSLASFLHPNSAVPPSTSSRSQLLRRFFLCTTWHSLN